MGILSQYYSSPGPTHCNLIIQIFRYLSGTLDLGIIFTADSEDELVGYTDSDYAGLIDSQKFTGSYILILSGGLLSNQLKLQSTVALSSGEAEYIATSKARKGEFWVAQFLACLEFRLPSQPVNLRADKKGSISLTENPEFHQKTKQIEVLWHWIREKVERKEIAISYISTKEMLADGLTKALSPKIFKDFRRMIGMT